MITFQTESFTACKDEFETLVFAHWDEIALDHSDVPLDIDWALYGALENINRIMFSTVRDDDKLVGYHLTMVSTHLHYRSTLHGIVDFYYIHPDYRKGFTGIKFLKYVEEELKKLGVKKIITGCKDHHNLSKLLERLGYKLSDHIFTKVLLNKQ